MILAYKHKAKCGHETKLIGYTSDGLWMEMPLNKDGVPDYCLACLEKHSIPCPCCGENIHVGEQIALGIGESMHQKQRDRSRPITVVNFENKVDGIYPVCMNCSDVFNLSAWLHPDATAVHFGSLMERVISSKGAVVCYDTSRIAQSSRAVTF
ncbi:MAG: hypothetical protein WCO12_01060 [bacterium]